MMFIRRATLALRQWPTWLLPCLPSSCALCGQLDRSALCQGCRERYFRKPVRRCVQCALPLTAAGKDSRCGICLKHRPAYDATIVASDYVAPADQLVLALKFGSRLALAPLCAQMLGDAMQQENARGLPLPTLLCVVPLGPQRLQQRGFNQALEIARPLARRVNIPLATELLERLRDTEPQTTLPVDERKRNMRRAFVVPSAAMNHVRGCHIGVIDDVMTTGETLGEIALTLKRFGAARVTNIVFARTLPK